MPVPMPVSIHMSTCMSIHMSVHMSIHMFIYSKGPGTSTSPSKHSRAGFATVYQKQVALAVGIPLLVLVLVSPGSLLPR